MVGGSKSSMGLTSATSWCGKMLIHEALTREELGGHNYPIACHFTKFSHLTSSLQFQDIKHTGLPRGDGMETFAGEGFSELAL